MVNHGGQPLNRQVVTRMLDRVAKAAGLGHVHPHRLRHTMATQAINRGMSLEAIAALLGHRSLDMTRRYARIANRTVADEYDAVSRAVENLYNQPLPADAEGPNMRRLRHEHRRMLGNGWCNRPALWTAPSNRSAKAAPTSPPTSNSIPSCSANANTPKTTAKPNASNSSTASSTTPNHDPHQKKPNKPLDTDHPYNARYRMARMRLSSATGLDERASPQVGRLGSQALLGRPGTSETLWPLVPLVL